MSLNHRRFLNFAASAAITLLAGSACVFADPPATGPAPLLDQISRETQSLFESVRPGLVRVELPRPKMIQPFGDADSPMQKWGGRLDPKVLEQLQEAQRRAAAGQISSVGAFVATSQPASSQPAASVAHNGQSPQPPGLRAHTILITRPDGEIEFIGNSAPPYDPAVVGMAAPRILGIVLDDAGHVLIPIFIDKDALDNRLLNVTGSDGKMVAARFVGSDRQTNLTVIELKTPLGKPMKLMDHLPADGSLVMLLSPNGENGRLSIWTGGQQDHGVLIATSGDLGGFVRMGQFLSSNTIKPIAQELIQDGKVRRATLGVWVSQAETPDGHPAMRIEQVIEHSAAADAGLQEGDYILSLAGAHVGDVPSFAAAIAELDGQTQLQVLHGDQLITVTVDLKPQ